MKIPAYLQKGDTVAIVSTARKITIPELQPALSLLESWGLNYILGSTIEASENQFAGDDELRACDFQNFLDDQNVKAIWCARGGYGTVRIIDRLDFSKFQREPKWIIGFSDITVLHSHVHKLGIATLHAQMPFNINAKTEETKNTLRDALFGKEYMIPFSSDHPLNRKGETEGMLVGGNLSILYALCGSPSALNTRNKILVLEDLDEYLYHVDRMMQNLKRNGMLSNLAALIVGGMSDMKDNPIGFGKDAEAIIFEAVKEYTYPVYFGCPVGHIDDNRALKLGVDATLTIDGEVIKVSM